MTANEQRAGRISWIKVGAVGLGLVGVAAILFLGLDRLSGERLPKLPVARSIPAAGHVKISLDYRPADSGPAILLRFPRNGVALVRSSDGRLALDAGGRRMLTPGAPEGRLAVELTLDFPANRLTVQAGSRVLRLRRRLAPERRVWVDANAARAEHVRITAPAVPPARSSLFAADSVWNAPLPDDAPLDRNSPELVKTLHDMVTEDIAAKRGPWIATGESSSPLYRVPGGQPLVRVQLHTGWWGNTLQKAFEAVPLPANAVPAHGNDAHLALWQPSTDRFWEFFHLRKLRDGWHADYGGAIKNVSRSPGYYDKRSWPGLSGTHWGASASSLPVVAGMMKIDELAAGEIRHAVSVAIPAARAKVFAWPAQRTDGVSVAPNAIPEGAHFRLDPRLDLTKLNLPRMTLMIARVVQRYGMIVADQTGHAVSFAAEDPTPTGRNPYVGATGLFGGKSPDELLAAFPWQHLQLLRMRLQRG
jgi:hypothetical protein